MRKHIVNILGIPYDDKSSFKKGAAKAPDEIRKVLHDGSSNYISETGIDISLVLKDCGDIQTADYQQISLQISEVIDLKLPSIFLGGDHSITYPIIQALNKEHGKFDILHFDAHADIYDELDGDRFSHACPFARILEDGLANSLVSVGIRNMPKHLLDQAKKFGIEIVMMKDIANMKILNFQNPLYISIDLDVLDPAFAPGVSHYEPGGLSTRELINMLHQIKAPIIGADIVELNSDRDPSGITSALAAKLLKEVVGLIVLNANF
ncbi:MAG: agmatinase [Bacteroidetes bacterium HGW-Bacteroidetes-17]|nr:MAG: agmatinase [Bacteroidetes bacterium HGW-Bacteroidetes-17]